MSIAPALQRGDGLSPQGRLQRRHRHHRGYRCGRGRGGGHFDVRTVAFAFGELDTLVPAYAALCRTHPQGPGIGRLGGGHPGDEQPYPMLQRNLLYTAVTRGRKLVVLVGQKKAVAITVNNAAGGRH